MKKLFVFLTISIITLCDAKQFYNIAIFCDEYNSSPNIVYGSAEGLLLAWVKLGLLILLSILALLDLLWNTKGCHQ